MPKIKNILIFVGIGTVLVLIYIFYIRSPSTPAAVLVSSTPTTSTSTIPGVAGSGVTQDFLVLLLSVKNIKLNDAILSDPAFMSLHDSSITLTPDGNEGRVNPFAPLGNDTVAPTTPSVSPNTTPAGNTTNTSTTTTTSIIP